MNQKCCNLMRFASIQCSKMRLRPGLRHGTCWVAYSALPDSLAGFKGAASWQGGGGEERKGQGGRGRGGEVD